MSNIQASQKSNKGSFYIFNPSTNGGREEGESTPCDI